MCSTAEPAVVAVAAVAAADEVDTCTPGGPACD